MTASAGIQMETSFTTHRVTEPIVVATLGLLLSALPLYAQSRSDTRRTSDITANDVAPAAPAPASPTTLRVRGTISRYDAVGGILSLSTPTGVVRFAVASAARLRRGGHDLALQQLGTLTGYRAAVRYSETGGHRTVESVHVFEQAERIAR
jgi:hypothetical protein